MAEQVRTAAPQWLATLLEDFATTDCARVCADSAGAYANCLAVSVDCAEWLRARGVECGLLCLAGSREPFPEGSGRWPFFDSRAIRHWTVRAGDWSIDWSARQFSPLGGLARRAPRRLARGALGAGRGLGLPALR